MILKKKTCQRLIKSTGVFAINIDFYMKGTQVMADSLQLLDGWMD